MSLRLLSSESGHCFDRKVYFIKQNRITLSPIFNNTTFKHICNNTEETTDTIIQLNKNTQSQISELDSIEEERREEELNYFCCPRAYKQQLRVDISNRAPSTYRMQKFSKVFC